MPKIPWKGKPSPLRPVGAPTSRGKSAQEFENEQVSVKRAIRMRRDGVVVPSMDDAVRNALKRKQPGLEMPT